MDMDSFADFFGWLSSSKKTSIQYPRRPYLYVVYLRLNDFDKIKKKTADVPEGEAGRLAGEAEQMV